MTDKMHAVLSALSKGRPLSIADNQEMKRTRICKRCQAGLFEDRMAASPFFARLHCRFCDFDFPLIIVVRQSKYD